jgi:hypothetical protein
MSTVCNYCSDEYRNAPLIDTCKDYSKKGVFRPGIYVGINVLDVGELYVSATPDTYEPGYMEESVKIKFCPMCGRKLEE